jgi:hypothetical protein
MTNPTPVNSFDSLSTGRASSLPFVDEFMTRDPNIYDIQYPIQKKWLNTLTGAFWELQSFNTVQSVTTATWVLISHQAVVVDTLTGNDGIVVPSTANNINVLGDVTNITTSGNAATSTLTVSLNGNIANTYVCDTGSATPSAHVLNVLGTEGVNTVGSGNTITVELTGGGPAIEGIIVDAHTAPGTSPVVPNDGDITVTGGQIAAGSTTNVIQTNSLAANTYTVQVQRSQASASSTIGDNGVSHYNSSIFTVDANGFVGLATNFYTTGTFTPVLAFGGASVGITYNAQAGAYTKIGNVVYFIVSIGLSSKGSSSGTATISGLPFAAGTETGNNFFMNASPITLPANTFQILAELSPSTSTLTLFLSAGTSPGASGFIADTNFLNTTGVQIEGFYFTS